MDYEKYYYKYVLIDGIYYFIAEIKDGIPYIYDSNRKLIPFLFDKKNVERVADEICKAIDLD